MDQTIATAAAVAEATLIAGSVGLWLSTIQELVFKDRLDGKPAFYLNVALSLAIGTAATVRTGGFVIVGEPGDPIGLAASILANASVALAASQAAFRFLVRPISAT